MVPIEKGKKEERNLDFAKRKKKKKRWLRFILKWFCIRLPKINQDGFDIFYVSYYLKKYIKNGFF